jgi:DNA-directed RNA polymerase specialized sigma24 family protein
VGDNYTLDASDGELRRSTPLTDPERAWLTDFFRAARDLCGKGGRGEDVVSFMVLEVARRLDHYMREYPDAADAARAKIINAGRDYNRREQVQRGAGAQGGRVVQTLDELGDDHPKRGVEDTVLDMLMLTTLLAALPEKLAKGLLLEAAGFTQDTVARVLGWSRTYYSRKASEARSRMRVALGLV